jgi:predicted component of type VI protein secretion system
VTNPSLLQIQVRRLGTQLEMEAYESRQQIELPFNHGILCASTGGARDYF